MKTDTIERVAIQLLNNNSNNAINILNEEYPFRTFKTSKRVYTDKMKFEQFVKDGFIDRYSGERLVNPGILKVISLYLPKEFPYHPHWKMDNCHIAYWELIPTIDHIFPVALGGIDGGKNYATTSMMHNLIKNNWTLEQLQWKLHAPGNISEWNGLTDLFITLVNSNKQLLNDAYIKRWHYLSVNEGFKEFL